jgi:hypothetical protein
VGRSDFGVGDIGFQPRSVGGEVWLDNVSVTSIARFSYSGPSVPSIPYPRDSVITRWEVAGPFAATRDAIARSPRGGEWRALEADERGALVTGRVVDFHGPQSVAYFRTRVASRDSTSAVLHISSVDDLALWVNGRFAWFIPRSDAAWYDFFRVKEHSGRRIPITLAKGDNDLVFRVRGGTYASGGFFARVERD